MRSKNKKTFDEVVDELILELNSTPSEESDTIVSLSSIEVKPNANTERDTGKQILFGTNDLRSYDAFLECIKRQAGPELLKIIEDGE